MTFPAGCSPGNWRDSNARDSEDVTMLGHDHSGWTHAARFSPQPRRRSPKRQQGRRPAAQTKSRQDGRRRLRSARQVSAGPAARKDAERPSGGRTKRLARRLKRPRGRKKTRHPTGGVRKQYPEGQHRRQVLGHRGGWQPANPVVVADTQVDMTFDEGGTGKNLLGGAMFMFPATSG